MAESEFVQSPKKGQKPRRVGYLKMNLDVYKGQVKIFNH